MAASWTQLCGPPTGYQGEPITAHFAVGSTLRREGYSGQLFCHLFKINLKKITQITCDI